MILSNSIIYTPKFRGIFFPNIFTSSQFSFPLQKKFPNKFVGENSTFAVFFSSVKITTLILGLKVENDLFNS